MMKKIALLFLVGTIGSYAFSNADIIEPALISETTLVCKPDKAIALRYDLQEISKWAHPPTQFTIELRKCRAGKSAITPHECGGERQSIRMSGEKVHLFWLSSGFDGLFIGPYQSTLEIVEDGRFLLMHRTEAGQHIFIAEGDCT